MTFNKGWTSRELGSRVYGRQLAPLASSKIAAPNGPRDRAYLPDL
jgi:hypothetical protein